MLNNNETISKSIKYIEKYFLPEIPILLKLLLLDEN